MKKMLFILFTLIVLLHCNFAKSDAIPHLYPLCGIITDIDYNKDTFIVTDAVGNDWVLTECEDWQIGDIVAMIMFDNNTPIIYDDIIIDYIYCGYIECF